MKKHIILTAAVFVILSVSAAALGLVGGGKPERQTITIAYFSAPWCPPCMVFKDKVLKSFLETYKEKYDGRLDYIEFDISDKKDFEVFKATARFHNANLGIPKMIIGETLIEDLSIEAMEAAIEKAVQNNERTRLVFKADKNVVYANLPEAAAEGDYDAVKSFLDKGADVNQFGLWTQTALQNAAFYGHFDVVKLLFTRPEIEINKQSDYGATGLTEAAFTGQEEIVRFLLSGDRREKADMFLEGKNGRNAVLAAALGVQRNILKIFRDEYGADLDKRLKNGDTPLMWIVTVRENNVSAVKAAEAIILEGADVNAPHGGGRTILSEAKTPEMRNLLISHGAK